MNAMVCEMCNSNDLVKQDGLYVCQHCGTKYSVEEARKLFVTVTIDKTEETRKNLILARRAKDNNDYPNARNFYALVMEEDPDNWEAVFFYQYFRAMDSSVYSMESAAECVANCLDEVLELIAALEDSKQQDEAVREVVVRCLKMADAFSKAAAEHYLRHIGYSEAVKTDSRNFATYLIYDQLEKALKKIFPQKTVELLWVQKSCLQFVCDHKAAFKYSARHEIADRLAQEITEQEWEYRPPFAGCYVATAVYGSYDCPPVWTLRRFRDQTLAKTMPGRAFIRAYYAVSPTLVKWFGKTNWFRGLCKPVLDRMVRKLNEQGVEDTPYKD